ncbi:MAG: hypothetical protein M0R40_01200 [Firmicutes bacterium]|nr:hypothetical protein [Bacillota bacterium]
MKVFGKQIDKQWFENYWYYYKKHTFVGIFILFIISYTAVECSKNVDPDVSVLYIGSTYFDNEFADKLEQRLSDCIEDINNDGVIKVQFSPIFISDEMKSEQDFAMQQKMQLEVAVGDSYLYLLDKKYYESYAKQDLFVDISPYIDANEPTYGLDAYDSPILQELGIKNDSQIYVAIRVLTQGDEKKQKKTANQVNAINIIKELYKND